MKYLHTDKAPAALGPYSQGVQAGNMLFLSGQIPIDATTGLIRGTTIEEATEQIFDNIEHVLAEAEATLGQVVKVTVFMQDLTEFDAMNAVYAKRFGGHKPARSTVQVARLPKDVSIEIEVTAVV